MIWWALGDKKKLFGAVRERIGQPGAEVSIASISVAEIARLADRRRIHLAEHWKTWMHHTVDMNGWSVLPATWEVMEEAYSLPGDFHVDPADRILVATARIHRMSIVTPDDHIRRYPHVDTVW